MVLMTILHIAECAGGVERYLQMLLPRQEARGIKLFFFTLVVTKSQSIRKW